MSKKSQKFDGAADDLPGWGETSCVSLPPGGRALSRRDCATACSIIDLGDETPLAEDGGFSGRMRSGEATCRVSRTIPGM